MKSFDVASRPQVIFESRASWRDNPPRILADHRSILSPLNNLSIAAKFRLIEPGDGVLEPLLIIIIVNLKKNLTLTGATKINKAIRSGQGLPQGIWLRSILNFSKGKFLKIQRINHNI